MKFKKAIPYDIKIQATPNNGFIVEVGCAKFAYAGNEQLIRDLTAYLLDPEGFEKQYNEDIAKLDRVHIRPYAGASGISMRQRVDAMAHRHRDIRGDEIVWEPKLKT